VTFPSLVLPDLPHVQISQVLFLCYAIPTFLLLSQDSGLVCFLLILLPAKVGTLAEVSSTFAALKRPFYGVNFLVLNKVGVTVESSSTLTALIQFSSSMNSPVLNESRALAEGFSTLIAYLDVNFLVQKEIRSFAEGSSTLEALKRPLSSVNLVLLSEV
jgi:hypothetical protein